MTGNEKNTAPGEDKLERLKNRFEINNTLILAIATLAVTWCSYQSGLWSGIQTFRLAEWNLLNRKAQEIKLLSVQHQAMDQSVLNNFVQSALEDKKEVVEFSLPRFRPELQTVLNAWIASHPLKNPKAAPHPMASEEYKALVQKSMQEAESYTKQADDYWHRAQQANTYSDRYNLFTVVFSMIMFLGAITTKMTHVRLSFTLITVSGIVCIAILLVLFFSMPLAKE